MKIRKFLALMLAATTLFAFTSCGDDEDIDDINITDEAIIDGHTHDLIFGAYDNSSEYTPSGYSISIGNNLKGSAVINIQIDEEFLGKKLDLTKKNQATSGWCTGMVFTGIDNIGTYWCDEDQFESGSLWVKKTGEKGTMTTGGQQYDVEYFRIVAKGKTYDGHTFSVSFYGPCITQREWWVSDMSLAKAQKNKKR